MKRLLLILLAPLLVSTQIVEHCPKGQHLECVDKWDLIVWKKYVNVYAKIIKYVWVN